MYNKEGRIKLETTAHIQNRLDTNIQFYNTDIGTADLVFDVTRNGSPLLVSSENADVFLILKNGTSYIVDTVTPTDPLNGRLKYTIPNEFLGLTGKVDGQLYIAVHGKEDIVTEVEFSFNIADSLINTIPAVDKLNEIRTFQEFRESIMTTINEINEALANGTDYVTQLEAAKTSGMKAINDRNEEVLDGLERNAIAFAEYLTNTKDNSIRELNEEVNKFKADVEALNKYDTTNWQKHKMTEDNGVRIWQRGLDPLTCDSGLYETSSMIGPPIEGDTGFYYVDVTVAQYGRRLILATYSAGNRSFVKTVHTNGVDTGWKEINPDVNKRQSLGSIGVENSEYNDLLALKAGLYECVVPSDAFLVNAPQEPNGKSYYAEIDVYEGNNGRKQLRLIMSHLNTEYHATVHTDGVESNAFKGWKRVQDAEEFEVLNSDTGWVDWEIMNDATKRQTDDPTALQCQYRVRTVNGVKIAHLRVNVNNVVTQTAFGSIPKHMCPKVQNFYIRTPVSMNPAVILVDLDGTLKFYCNLNDTSKWLPGHYIYGEFTWIIDDLGGN